MNATETENDRKHSTRQVPVNRRASNWSEEEYTVGEDEIQWEGSRTEQRSQRDPDTGEIETWENEVSEEMSWGEVETREVNQFAVLEKKSRSFESNASSSHKREHIDLICFDGEACGVLDLDDHDNWYIPHQYEDREHDQWKNNDLMRRYTTARNSDRQRSYKKHRIEIDRELIERYDEVYAVKWKHSASADRNGSISSSKPIKAVKLETDDE